MFRRYEAVLLVSTEILLTRPGGEFLQTSHASEADHRPFSSSEKKIKKLRSAERVSFGHAETLRGRPAGLDRSLA